MTRETQEIAKQPVFMTAEQLLERLVVAVTLECQHQVCVGTLTHDTNDNGDAVQAGLLRGADLVLGTLTILVECALKSPYPPAFSRRACSIGAA